MKCALLVLLCITVWASVVLSSSPPSSSSSKAPKWHQLTSSYSFESYLKDFHKAYPDPQAYKLHAKYFYENLQKILQQNSNPSSLWKAGVNSMTDLSPEEFKSRLGYKHLFEENSPTLRSIRSNYQVPYVHKDVDLNTLSKDVDWRSHGIISSVKDQGGCGSCWTFGTAEIVESYWANKTGQLGDLSEQQILDCTPNPDDCGGTGGCGGGTPELAYAQIIKTGGLSSEWQYPYLSYFGAAFTCSSTTKNMVAKLSGYTKLPANQMAPILVHLATVGPLAVNVDASSWANYESGVFDGCNKTNPDIDHVVQLVGYGTDEHSGEDYWLVRNSWSPAWGEAGYIKLYRGVKESCGVDLHPQDGTGCNGGPTSVTVCGSCGIWYDTSFPLIKV